MKPRQTLGPFELVGRLGGGGMGEVWEGRDRSGVAVALKVITSSRAQKEKYRAAFRNEVRAMASLHHRGVVMVYDYGQSAGELTFGDSTLAPGSPYLAMELADTSLNRLARQFQSWEDVRELLVQTLDALAHAHARGVIHRDIKPPNILLASPEGPPVYKLADFGLAHAADAHGSDEISRTTTGTPRFMAPEQILGRWRDQGPWTDLYALGCVAFWLVTASPPFNGDDNDTIFRAHLTKPVPEVEARLSVPTGFETWLRGMLAKDPVDRYRRAADALFDLRKLGQGEFLDPITNVGLDESSQPTMMDTFTPTSSLTNSSRNPTTREARSASDPTLSFEDAPWFDIILEETDAARTTTNRPALPQSWRRDETPPPSIESLGAGIGLFGLRPAPLVGRTRERDRIWEMLAAVEETQSPRCVLVSGPSGAGKSRIVEWVAQRAHEVGVVEVLKASHSPIGGELDGAVGMLNDYCRTRGLNRARTRKRLERLMSDDRKGRSFNVIDVMSMMEILRPHDPEGTGWAKNARESERHAILEAFLEQTARERPLLLWLDDAQWGASSLRFAIDLIESGNLPALVVCTVRDDVEISPTATEALASIQSCLETIEIQVGTLPEEAHSELVRRLLRLDSELTREVVSRTQGNPLFAIQLIGDWIDRGVLDLGEEGFELTEGATAEVPDSIHNVWLGRLFTVFHRIERRETAAEPRGDSFEAIELASALGRDVEEREWKHACELAAFDVPETLTDELAASRLITLRDGGFTFEHTLMCESLARSAREKERFEDHHRICARTVADLYADSRGASLRRAEHLLRAGEYEEALEPLLLAAEERAQRGDFQGAIELDDQRDHALDAARVAADDARRAHGWIRRARTRMLMGQIAEAAALVQRAEEVIDDDDLASMARLRWSQSTLARHRSDSQKGVELAEESRDYYAAVGDELGVARCEKKLGEFHRRRGSLELSVAHYSAAMTTFEAKGDDFEIGWAQLGLGATLRQLGHLERALVHISKAQQTFERIGSGVGIGAAYNEMGEVERFMGRYENAESHYLRVLAHWGRQRHAELDIVRYNIALTKIHQREWSDARELLTQIFIRALESSNGGLRVYTATALVEACCGLQEFDEAHEYLERLRKFLRSTPLVDTDIAVCMDQSGDLAFDAERLELAQECWALAESQWRSLDKLEKAADAAEKRSPSA